MRAGAVGLGAFWAAPAIRTIRVQQTGGTPPPSSTEPTLPPELCTFGTIEMSGDQETPPVITTGTGTAVIAFDEATNELCVQGSFQNLIGTSTAAHIHGPAAAGEGPAGVQVPLAIPLGVTSGNIILQCFTLTATQRDYLCAGLMYFNIHSTFRPGGEIRGQIEPV